MIPNDQLQLLTAAVDGELTPAEDRRVRLLLVESVEARKAFARLRADSDRLRMLPLAAPPADLHPRIMTRLPEPTPITTPAPAKTPARPGRYHTWVPLAVAASLLLAIAGGSLWFSTRQDQPNANNGNPHIAATDPNTKNILPRDNAALPSVPHAVDPPVNHVAAAPNPVAAPEHQDELPPPRPIVKKDGYAYPLLPPITFKLVQIRLPFLASVSDLDRDDVQQKLIEELGRDPAFRIDLFATDVARGVEVFQATAKGSGVNLFVDAMTQDRIKRKLATAYVVYAESLTAKDLRDLFSRVAAEDGKRPQRVFGTLHVTTAGPIDQRELKDLFGTDPGLWKRPALPGTTPTEPKSISSGTGDQLARTLTGPKPGEKPAFLTTFTPAAFRTHPTMSKELKEYLARRGERGASAVPVLIVIRQSTGG